MIISVNAEDVVVDEQMTVAALLQSLGDIATQENLGRIEWSCLDWNTPSLEFYSRMGAKPQNEWVHLRVDEADFAEFSAK